MITVFGSINIDLVTRVPVLPGAGETVLGPDYAVIPGGKGANQALAARRAGAIVKLIGAVGEDAFADLALALLREDGVDLAITRCPGVPTGAAFIALDAAGQNQIVVAAGANGRLTAHVALGFASGDWLVLQREVPDRESRAVAAQARAAGARVLLNSAPGGRLDDSFLDLVDVLVVNEHEALMLSDSSASEPLKAAADLAVRGTTVIVTLGGAGAVGFAGADRFVSPAPQVDVVDTVAAGDAFVGALAAALDRGESLSVAMSDGVAAGSLACTQPGAQTSLPWKTEIARLAETVRTTRSN